MIRRKSVRHGATAVEAAVVLPVLFLFVFGLIVGGLGAFRNNQVGMLAREGSRWAAVHGSAYQTDAGQPVTAEDVYNNAIKPMVVGLDTSKLTYSVTYSPDNKPGSSVTVTVNYRWYPEVYLAGPFVLTCSSTRAVSY